MSLSIDSQILRCQKCFMVKQIIIEPNYPQTTISSECHCGIVRQTIVSFIKELQKGELYVVKCSFCKKQTKDTLYCTGCRRTYCKTCNKAHNFKIKTKTPHKLIDSYKYDFYCSTHHEELLNAYCKTCCINMCQKCISEKLHKGHRFVKFSKISLTQKDEDNLVNNIKNYADKIEGNVKRTNELYNLHTDEEVKEELKDVCTATVVDNKSILALVKYFQNIYHAINPKNYAIIYNVIENIKFNPQPMPPDCDSSLEEKTLDFVEYLKRDFVLFKRFNAPKAKNPPSQSSIKSNKPLDNKDNTNANKNNINNTSNNNKKKEGTNQNLKNNNKKDEANINYSYNVIVNTNPKSHINIMNDIEEEERQKEAINQEKAIERPHEEEQLYQIKNLLKVENKEEIEKIIGTEIKEEEFYEIKNLLKMEDKFENNEKIKSEEESNNENNQIHDNEKIVVDSNIVPEITLLNGTKEVEANKEEEKQENEKNVEIEKKEEIEKKVEIEKKEEEEVKPEQKEKKEEKEEKEIKPEEKEKKEENLKKEEQKPEIKNGEENKEKTETTENPTAAPGHILGLPLELAAEMDNLKKEQELKKEREAKRKMRTQRALERLRNKNQKEKIANSTSNNSILNNPKFLMIAKMMSDKAMGGVKKEDNKKEPDNTHKDIILNKSTNSSIKNKPKKKDFGQTDNA